MGKHNADSENKKSFHKSYFIPGSMVGYVCYSGDGELVGFGIEVSGDSKSTVINSVNVKKDGVTQEQIDEWKKLQD
ncbi:hypothetical protein [Enterobacter ludwigii]|uniref:hypothetical protein n=1 Tax=Enterobacter ludwigii TaxID=299767 RepID=UPI0006432BCE|nr:hypothetical protein [Enterobacter ludwigii]KLP41763.1 hypothetical protein ABR36_07935 [Enterobacter ludwigii]